MGGGLFETLLNHIQFTDNVPIFTNMKFGYRKRYMGNKGN